MLSNHFGDELLPIILPIVQQRLHDSNWRSRESGARRRRARGGTAGASLCLMLSLPCRGLCFNPPHYSCVSAAILALGAVSQGCATGLAPYLPEMVAMLLPTLKDPRPMVRCIRCAACVSM